MTSTISPPRVQNLHYENDGFHVEFQTLPGRVYSLEYCDDLTLGDWVLLAGPLDGDGSIVTWIDSEARDLQRRFYRLVNTVQE